MLLRSKYVSSAVNGGNFACGSSTAGLNRSN